MQNHTTDSPVRKSLFSYIDGPDAGHNAGPGRELPRKHSQHAAGYDLEANETIQIVGGGGTYAVHTGLRLRDMDISCFGKLEIRSGLAYREHLAVSAGVIDADYTGEILVLVFCTKVGHTYTIKQGERFAQMIVHRLAGAAAPMVGLTDYDVQQMLQQTMSRAPDVNDGGAVRIGWASIDTPPRGNGGFGSTGTGRV